MSQSSTRSAKTSSGKNSGETPASNLSSPFDITRASVPQALPGDIANHIHSRDYSVEVVTRWQDLENQADPWNALSDESLEPNVFYSSYAVLAAMKHLDPAGDPEFVVVKAVDRGAPKQPPIWCAFFPFMRFGRFRGVPCGNLQLLKHDYCFLRTPLVRRDCAEEVLELVLQKLETSATSILELADQTAEGPLAHIVSSLLHDRGDTPWIASMHARAKLERGADGESYLRTFINGGKVKELRRLERRLGEQGELRYECAGSGDDDERLESAVSDFLELEAGGWKGREGTAIACKDNHRAFFADLVHGARGRGRIRLLSLRLNGKPLAMKCNLISPPGSFAFKIAYSEEHARSSPGLMLEVENVRRVHAEDAIEWMDSCADPGHPMIEQVWGQRRLIQTIVVPLSAWGRFVTAILPGLQWIKRSLRRPKRVEKTEE